MLRAQWLQQAFPKSSTRAAFRPYSTPPTQFQSVLAARTFSFDLPNDNLSSAVEASKSIESQTQKWNTSELCRVIVGINNTKESPFPVISKARNTSVPPPTDKITNQFDALTLLLASLNKPYVAVINGQVCVGIHAPFRVATEQTIFQVPALRLGHMSGGGVHHMLARLDGSLGTFLALTGTRLYARTVFEQGIATHYIPERRIAELVHSMSSFEAPSDAIYDLVDAAIEELHFEHTGVEPELAAASLRQVEGEVRFAIDAVYGLPTVKEIVVTLQDVTNEHAGTWLGQWADEQLRLLKARSPEALVVALEAVRRSAGSLMTVLAMEDRLAGAYQERLRDISDPKEELIGREWGRFADMDEKAVIERYFGEPQGEQEQAREAGETTQSARMTERNYGLPTEGEILELVEGTHAKGAARNANELELFFYNLRGHKHGVREKLMRAVQRLG